MQKKNFFFYYKLKKNQVKFPDTFNNAQIWIVPNRNLKHSRGRTLIKFFFKCQVGLHFWEDEVLFLTSPTEYD